jgi:predicted phage-related endonuclease
MPALTPANDLIRSRNVSASECYALLGKHPYATKQGIFDRLTSPASFGHPEQSRAMSLGVYFERHIAAYTAKTYGLKLRANTRTREHPTVNLCATPDYIVLGSKALVEVKLSGITYGWTEDTLHPWYEYQARAQMACTNCDVVFIAALVGSSFYFIPVTRDPVKEKRLLDAVDEFFNEHVLTGIRPTQDDAKIIAQVMAS